MTRRDFTGRPARTKPEPPTRKGRSLLAGLMIGLIGGMIVAGGLYWYLVAQPGAFKVVESAPELTPPPHSIQVPEQSTLPEPQPEPAKPATETPATPNPEYSFYDILPGKTAPQPAPQHKAPVQHWLQVAALKNAEEADRLKAKLTLLNLNVSIHKVRNDGVTLHRVRVGPFASEDEGLNALDTLAVNDFEPRWVKDPVHQ